MKSFHLGLFILVVASLALPLAIRHHAQLRLDELNAAIQRQAKELSQLAAANDQLSNTAVRADALRALSEPERLELLSLRSEVGRLRQQTNLLEQLRSRATAPRDPAEATSQPAWPQEVASREEAFVAQAITAMSNICLGLQSALRSYAAEHTNRLPTDLLELRAYFPTASGPQPGFYSFDFLSDVGPLGAPGDALVLRARQQRQTADGKWMRLYAFGDGRVVQAISDDGNFEAWESQHKVWPPATNQTWSVRQSP